MIKFLKRNWELVFLFVFVVIACVLRFYNITKLQFFTYDQARDALFVKRMIVDHQWRLLGTQTSLPGMYLPPFYFYTIMPVLWLFRLNPVGIDVYSAFVGVLTVPVVFFIANKIFGRPAGVFSAGIFAVSPIVVELTRRAWNCNTMPFYILLSFYFLYRYFKNKAVKDFLLAFGFYGYCLSLHFGSWTLMPLFIYMWFSLLFGKKEKKGIPRQARDDKLIGLLGGLGILFFFISPLLFFEIRHRFFLTGQAKVFFFDGGHIGPATGNFFESLISSLISLFTILISGKITVGYGAPLEFSGKLKEFFSASQQISVVAQKPFSLTYQWWGTAIFILIIFYSLYKFYKYYLNKCHREVPTELGLWRSRTGLLRPTKVGTRNDSLKNDEFLPLFLIWVWILWGVFISRIYSGKFFFFYYLYLFPAPILLFGYLCKKGWEVKLLKPLVIGVFLSIIFFHWHYSTIFEKGWRELGDLKKVGEVIAKNVSEGKTFNIATIQKDLDRWDRNAVDYRYFTEAFYKKRALDWYPEDYQKAEELFIVDEEGKADVLNSNIMEIMEFKPKQIIGKWQTDKGMVIYKIEK